MFRHDFGLIFWIHVGVVALAYASPFLFSPWYIIAGFLVFWLQSTILGACALSRWQFGDRPDVSGFFHYYLRKLGLDDPSGVIRTIDRTRPLVILFSMLWQWGLGFQPVVV